MSNDETTKRVEVIKIGARMADPKGILIPRGMIEQLSVEIADEVAMYHFRDSKVTRRFAEIEIRGDEEKGLPKSTVFIQRTGKAVKAYPGKTKEEIRDIILEELKELGVNAKENNGKK